MKFLIPLLLLTSPALAEFMTGVDANYALDMEKRGKTWAAGDPYKTLAAAGADSFRVRLWTGDDGMNGLTYATETAKRAQAAGLKPYLVIFLSENWADYVKQPVPAIWKDLSYDDKVKAVEAYAERVTRRFKDAGIAIELFEIGNEIDFGICGEFEEEWPKRVSLDYMKARIWSRMAPIIAAAQRGVKRVQPNAKFILHLTQWDNTAYCTAFWKFMTDNGVAVDHPGLSYFPTNHPKPEQRTLAFLAKQLEGFHTATGKPLVICEYAYPSLATFPGQFADWNKPIEGYTLDEAGQTKWLADFLKQARASQHLAGAYYWSPEWYASEADMWKAFALFDEKGVARPAMASFAKPRASINVYFGNLHAHTGVSDGTGTPAEAYAYGRDVGKLDFLALTEHNHLMGGENATAEQRKSAYSDLVAAADKASTDGRFVALYGQEFSSMSKGNHVNVFDVRTVIDVPNGQFAELVQWLDRNRDSSGQAPVLQFNHPALGRPGKTIDPNEYGRDDFGGDAAWVAAMGKLTPLIELLNGEPDGKTPAGRAPQVMDKHYAIYLKAGFRLAPTGNQDNHKVNWGTATEVRTAILAPELTRAALLSAMRRRNVYATEDRNLRVILRVNGELTGGTIDTPGELKIAYDIVDTDEPNATYTIDVFRGVVGGEVAAEVKSATSTGNSTGTIDGVSLTQSGQYLFVRVTQQSEAGKDRAWLAPVWLEVKR